MILASCSQGTRQADQLDNAANQAVPAAATVMRNEADQIRANGSDANSSAASSPVQSAMQNAGDAAANAGEPSTSTDTASQPVTSDAHAKPHRAGDPVPPPQSH